MSSLRSRLETRPQKGNFVDFVSHKRVPHGVDRQPIVAIRSPAASIQDSVWEQTFSHISKMHLTIYIDALYCDFSKHQRICEKY
ncbi:hypothetical protein E2C01_060654 [Portunus trituberculatus]|uniref:Uncharacterized protein n=1 Tax=Portunus trituberculatus TaxID=210409 RepID=A0A5B7H9B1_PORTR|nr:hypothetical protein [Portunus trituberculatus]